MNTISQKVLSKREWGEIWKIRRQKDPLLDFIMCLRRIFDAPCLVGITGEWKSGKTDFGLLLGELLFKLGKVTKIGSNIVCKHPDIPIDYVADNETLKYWLHKDNTRKLYIFDEAIKHAYKRSPMARKQVDLIKVITEISKGHAWGIVITQDATMVDKDLTNPAFTRAWFIKGGFHKRTQVEISSFLIKGTYRKFIGVPKTTIDFNPYLEADFSEKESHPILKHPDINIFYRYCVKKESFRNIAMTEKTYPPAIMRRVRRVGRILCSILLPKAEEVEKALANDKEKP